MFNQISFIAGEVKKKIVSSIAGIGIILIFGYLYLLKIQGEIESEMNGYEVFFIFFTIYMLIYSIYFVYVNFLITIKGKRAGQQQDIMEALEEDKFNDDRTLANPSTFSGIRKAYLNSALIGNSFLLLAYLLLMPNLRGIVFTGYTFFHIVVVSIFSACIGYMIFKNKKNILKFIKFKQKAKKSEITLPPYPEEKEFSFVIGEQHRQKGERMETPKWFTVSGKGLYTGFLVVGDTGSGKTTTIGFPFLMEAIKKGLGGLVLDAGIQYINFVKDQMAKAGRSADLVIIDKTGQLKYNPIARKEVSSVDLAGAIFQVIKNLSPAQTTGAMDAYWEQAGTNFCMAMIELLRLYHAEDQHITLDLLYRWNINETERKQVLEALDLEKKNGTTPERTHRIDFVLNFFNRYWPQLGSKHSSSISAQFNSVVSMFSSDFDLNATFCPGPDEENVFKGFTPAALENKIVVLNMPAKDVSGRVIGTFLKLDFQRAVLRRSEGKSESDIKKPCFFLCDEAQNFVSSSKDSGDAIYLAESRKNLPINLYMSQSIDSFLDAFKDDKPFNVFLNLLRTKIIFSQEGVESQKICADLCGKETQYKRSYTTTEAGRDTQYSYEAGEFLHMQSAQSRATAKNEEIDYTFQPHDFRSLPAFVSIVSPFTGERKLQPRVIYAKPIFISSSGEIQKIDRGTWFQGDRAKYRSYLEYVKDEDGLKRSIT